MEKQGKKLRITSGFDLGKKKTEIQKKQ